MKYGSMAATCLSVGLAALQPASASQVSVIHTFDKATEGSGIAALAVAPDGRLFSVLNQNPASDMNPVLFEFDPPTTSSSSWTSRLIYRVPTPTIDPVYSTNDIPSMLIDRHGNLIFEQHTRDNVTQADTEAIYELVAPSASQPAWTRRPLIMEPQTSGHGLHGISLSYVDSGGVIFGFGEIDGSHAPVVFRLAPSSAGAAYRISTVALLDQDFEVTSLVPGPNRSFFGSTYDDSKHATGTVFRLSPPVSGSTTWQRTTVFTSQAPSYGPVVYALDRTPDLFGGISYVSGGNQVGGAVFRLSPQDPAGASWSYSTLIRSTGSLVATPYALAEDRTGVLYGVTGQQRDPISGRAISEGTVFKLVPAASGVPWHQTTLAVFPNALDNNLPGPLQTWFKPDGSRAFFGFLPTGTKTAGQSGSGTIFEIIP